MQFQNYMPKRTLNINITTRLTYKFYTLIESQRLVLLLQLFSYSVTPLIDNVKVNHNIESSHAYTIYYFFLDSKLIIMY